MLIFCTLNFMEHRDSYQKMMDFAENGKGRRLLNALSKRDNGLTALELDEVLKTYCRTGLVKEVETLKKIRGILSDEQYHGLAEAVRTHGCAKEYDAFAVSLRNLLSCGMKMNPAKTPMED